MAKQNIAETVRALIEDTVTGLGYDLWDVEFVKEGASYYLRVTIDSADGVSIDDCEKVHRTIDPMLDEADPIEDSYYLQVSSPGIERVLRTDEHLKYGLGKTVDVKLYRAAEGKKSFTGILNGFDGSSLGFMVDGAELKAERSNVSKINIHFDFEE